MGLLRDLRHALRALARNPGFALAAAATLALGIAANTVIFSLADAILLQPLPYRSPERLVVLWEGRLSRPGEKNVISAANFLDWRRQSRSFEQMALSTWSGLTLTDSGSPERLSGRAVTANLFSVLGVAPRLGRTFAAEEEAPGGPAAILLSHGLWMRRFGGDPNVVGRKVGTDSGPALVAGVMPKDFRPLGDEEYWEPFRFTEQAGSWGRFAIGWARLKPGVSAGQAQLEMSEIARGLERVRPESDAGWGVRVVPIAEDVSGSARPLLLVLAGAVMLLFLLACANVANLLLGRALAREKETAIRTALGASRFSIARQWIAEGLLLAGAGCAVGLAAAAWALHAIAARTAGRLPRVEEAALSGRSVLFAAAVSSAAGLAFGLLSGAKRRNGDLAASLSGGDRATSGRCAALWKAALVSTQVAIALVLLVGAGLIARSLGELGRVRPGFDPEGVLTFRMTLPESRYATARSQNDFFEEVAARVRAIPGVRAAGLVSTPPLGGFGPGTSFLPDGSPPVAAGEKPTADIRTVDPGGLAALGIPLLAGRGFAESDRAGSPPVVVVNRTLADRIFGGRAVGRRLNVSWGLPDGNGPVEIVGVAGDVRLASVDKPARPTIYYSTLQSPNSLMNLVVKSSGDPEALLPKIREEVTALDPLIAVERPATLEALLDRSLEGRRLPMLFLAPFSAAALLLAAVGLYGVLAFAVRERTREVGIRVALGAGRADVLRLVLGRAAVLVGAGLAAGAAAALFAARFLGSLLFEVAPSDPATFAAVALGVAAVSLAASWLPARRALRIDPARALRSQ